MLAFFKKYRFLFLPLLFALPYMVHAAGAQPSKNAKKALKQAEKYMAVSDKISEAGELIKEALADSILAKQAKTYYIAGKIEVANYNEGLKKLSINKNDPSVDKVKLADALMSARKYYQKAIDLDTVIDTKGALQTEYSEKLLEWLNSQTNQFYNSGVAYLNKKLYYPQAYDAFMAYADSPEKLPEYNPHTILTDSARANGYFYAGVMAFNAGEYAISADAFEKARELNYPRKEVVVNEMVCYRKIADADSTRKSEALRKITLLSEEGVDRFGIEQPMFIQNFVGGSIREGKFENALNKLDSLIALYPNSASSLLGLRGETNLAMKDTVNAINDFALAAEDSTASFHTLLQAAKLSARQGIKELTGIAGNNKTAKKRRTEIKEKWLRNAKSYTERAKAIAAERSNNKGKKEEEISDELLHDLDNTIATIDYYLVL